MSKFKANLASNVQQKHLASMFNKNIVSLSTHSFPFQQPFMRLLDLKQQNEKFRYSKYICLRHILLKKMYFIL